MDDVLNLLKSRRSIRKYKDKPVEEEKIQKCLEAARWAPSASNKQPWEFLIVTDEATRIKLSELHPYAKFVAESPVVFIPLTNPEIHQKYHMSDTALATMQYMIEAHSLGLGSFWVGVYNLKEEKSSSENQIKELLNIPESYRIISMLPLGVPNISLTKKRKPISEIMIRESF